MAQQKKLKIGLVERFGIDLKRREVALLFQGLADTINRVSGEITFDSVEIMFSSQLSNDDYKLTNKSITTLTPLNFIKLSEEKRKLVNPILIVKKENFELPYYNGYFISGKGTSIQSLNDSQIKTLYLKDPNSVSGYIAPLYKLWELGVIDEPSVKAAEKKWRVKLLGDQAEVIDSVAEWKNSIGATGQTFHREVKVLYRYGFLPQDVIVLSNDLAKYQSQIQSWFIKLFAKKTNGEFINPGALLLLNSTTRLSGVEQFTTEHKIAYQQITKMYQIVTNNISVPIIKPIKKYSYQDFVNFILELENSKVVLIASTIILAVGKLINLYKQIRLRKNKETANQG